MKQFLLLMALLLATTTNAQQVLPLYEKAIPNSKPSPDTEKSEVNSSGILIISNVSVPTLTVYKPVKPSPMKSSVIICPGGGYGILASGHEGADVARVLNSWGVTAFVLKYRLPNDATMNDKSIGPLQDVQRALQMVREHAAEWNIDVSKIGVMGFSAGGHLAATASTHFDKGVIDNPENISLRPDFSILIYPVISFSNSLTHAGSRENLLGKIASPNQALFYSNELAVTAQTPPAFLVHSADDDLVPVGNSIAYYKALQEYKIFSEMILYPHGGHGYGMDNKTTEDKWMDRLKEWMAASGIL
ncbi:alpha/beta hydrolase [Flavobacterium album]|uniref:Alpha/beta hydrolase n=1 Tax=Flavobacterium album TaxID=2175091 RepID=A0A2S1R2U9_9FLAO|nr:alpha/beta hydrolase [Flavobacterium album]AWH86906.1 alpha/beta hydrolase [Flavobacterium album]